MTEEKSPSSIDFKDYLTEMGKRISEYVKGITFDLQTDNEGDEGKYILSIRDSASQIEGNLVIKTGDTAPKITTNFKRTDNLPRLQKIKAALEAEEEEARKMMGPPI